tara:strand:- start:1795 stop:1983 length:189 start_codon:yes stop_codon:yes gene_type:complete
MNGGIIMSKKIAFLVAGGALVVLLQWAVPAAYSAVVADEEAAQSCPASGSCPVSKQSAEAEV